MTTTIQGPTGKVIGYIIKESGENYLILDHNQKRVGRVSAGVTMDVNGRVIARGNQPGLLLNR